VTARASVVVSTLDRAAYLARLLDALETVDGPPFEVVVVNGPSSDDTEAVLARRRGRLKALHCPVANLSRSRNVGIAAAAGDIVVLIDDDALPAAPGWLAGLCAPLVADARVGGVGGPVLEPDGRAYEFEGRVVSEYGELVPPFEAARRGVAVDGVGWVPGVQGANCAFRRDAVVAVGGFDERFVYVFDESDLCMRIVRAGWTIAYAPRSAVVHDSATGARRRSPWDRDWWTIAQADAYFALKTARDPLPRRLVETVRRARGKWPYWQINAYYHERRYGLPTRLRHLARWAGGVASGVWLGVAARRATPLGPGTRPPPAFLPFR
jgi:glycogen(starch) synthase